MQRLDVPLDLFDPLDDLLLEDLLAPLNVALVRTTMSALQINCCPLHMRLGEHLNLIYISSGTGRPQLVELQRVVCH